MESLLLSPLRYYTSGHVLGTVEETGLGSFIQLAWARARAQAQGRVQRAWVLLQVQTNTGRANETSR